MQREPTQVFPTAQRTWQPLQFCVSFVVLISQPSLASLLQLAKPVSHVMPHPVAAHAGLPWLPNGHCVLQKRQFFGSLDKSAHPVAQQTQPAAQDIPHPLQFVGSDPVSVQA
jgi:hypothetical protein